MIFCLALLVSTLAAQTLTLIPSVTTVAPGGSFTILIAYTAPAPAATALQWSLNAPAGLTMQSATSVAGKTLFKVAASSTVMLLGANPNVTPPTFNTTVIPVGDIATYTVTAPSTFGPLAFSLTGTQGSLAAPVNNPASVLVTPGAAITVTVRSPIDLNGDGVSDITDLQIVVNAATPTGVCTNPIGDLNGDSKCDVTDATFWILRKLSGL